MTNAQPPPLVPIEASASVASSASVAPSSASQGCATSEPLPGNDELLELAAELARAAGNILRDRLDDDSIRAISTKTSLSDVVTELDQASEEYIVGVLRQRRPDDSILGEEGTAITGTSSIRWVIDPLDGTVNFLYGIANFAVSVGVEIDGAAVAGAIYNPGVDELFTARANGGAFCNDKPIVCNEYTGLNLALVGTGFAYLAEIRSMQAAFLTTLLTEIRDIRRMGSAALDLCNVACGRVDAYYECGVKPWDVSAGALIAREAGALVSGWSQDAPHPTVIAGNPTIYSELRERLARDHRVPSP